MKMCESCGMPLEAKTTSKFDARYCIYCQDQKTGRLATREHVREGIQNYFMAHEKMNRKQAEKATDEMMTKLPRWKK